MSKSEKKSKAIRIVLIVLIAVILLSLITALIVRLVKRNTSLPERVSVTWVLDGKKTKTEEKAYLYGERIEDPFEPELTEDTAVDGWYTDKGYTTPYKFTTKLKKDLTLYGRTVYDDPNLWYIVGEGKGTLEEIQNAPGVFLLEQDLAASTSDYSVYQVDLELYAGDKFHIEKGRSEEGSLGYTELLGSNTAFEAAEKEISLKEKYDGIYRISLKIFKTPDTTYKNGIQIQKIKSLDPIPLATYTVTFDLGSYTGSEKVAPMSAKEGQKITLPNAPQWSGHTFLHWASGEKTYAAGTSITIYGSGTLRAVWDTDKPA